ncbi:hypothetical protein BE18_39470 [Sorangium cellulosum]|uniref:Uncharacterized protein n=1 Tax=Sorangium cellulosum TaxID=56 RepID=A0A150R9C2_SORCE|nr:hypothetical protein BE18_39470 [Sorangium cellulosum]
MRPVDLRLLAGKRAQPLECFRRLLGAETADHSAQMIGTARIAALLQHDEEATGPQRGILAELLDDEGHEGVDHGRARRDDLRVDARLSEHGLHGGVVQPELAGDGADGPLLAMVEAQDLRPTCSGVNTRILRVP